jgi:hypothetical protein
MNDNERKGPAAEGQDGQAKHGYRNEVSWDDGKGRQPYANQGDEEQHADALPEPEAGNAGEAAGRNVEQLRAVKGTPERPTSEAPREDVSHRGGVS